MLTETGIILIGVVTFCFGLLVGIQADHIRYMRRLTRLARRCLETGTLAPVLLALETKDGREREGDKGK
ncbi:MAG: hypothetical protein NT074_01060 [Methanomicrobiales archaeon]|nr:hypothetical protein [Methanomicrobiales archaeon]